MPDDRETIAKLVDELEQGLSEGTLTPDQEETLREEIGDLQMNVIIGDLLTD
jgi:hypothetical protein